MAQIQAEALDDAVQRYMMDPEARRDPYPLYDRLRSTDPLYRCAPLKTWYVTGYDEARAVLKDRRASTSPLHAYDYQAATGELGRARRQLGRMILWIDPPEHTRLRALIGRTFNPRGAERWHQRIDSWADEMADALVGRDEIDVLHEAGMPVPLWLTCELLGIPRSTGDDMMRWTARYMKMMNPSPSREEELAADQVFVEFDAVLAPFIEERMSGKVVREDLLDEFVAAEKEGKLTRDEVLAYSLILMVAAHETTASMLNNGIYTLMRHRDAWDAIVADHALIPGAIEEIIRFESPSRNAVLRWATEDIEVLGRTIPAGERIVTILSAANRDPRVFDDPGTFDIRRSPNRHIGFGMGGHVCLGAPLARMEATAILRALAQRFPRMELAGDAAWDDGYMMRILNGVRVRLEPNGAR